MNFLLTSWNPYCSRIECVCSSLRSTAPFDFSFSVPQFAIEIASQFFLLFFENYVRMNSFAFILGTYSSQSIPSYFFKWIPIGMLFTSVQKRCVSFQFRIASILKRKCPIRISMNSSIINTYSVAVTRPAIKQ